MRSFLALAILAAATPAFAQTVPTAPLPSLPQPSHTLTLTDKDWATVIDGLLELKAKDANPIIGKIQQEVAEQTKVQKDAADAKAKAAAVPTEKPAAPAKK